MSRNECTCNGRPAAPSREGRDVASWPACRWPRSRAAALPARTQNECGRYKAVSLTRLVFFVVCCRRGLVNFGAYTLNATYLSPYIARLRANGSVEWAYALTDGFGVGQVRGHRSSA